MKKGLSLLLHGRHFPNVNRTHQQYKEILKVDSNVAAVRGTTTSNKQIKRQRASPCYDILTSFPLVSLYCWFIFVGLNAFWIRIRGNASCDGQGRHPGSKWSDAYLRVCILYVNKGKKKAIEKEELLVSSFYVHFSSLSRKSSPTDSERDKTEHFKSLDVTGRISTCKIACGIISPAFFGKQEALEAIRTFISSRTLRRPLSWLLYGGSIAVLVLSNGPNKKKGPCYLNEHVVSE